MVIAWGEIQRISQAPPGKPSSATGPTSADHGDRLDWKGLENSRTSLKMLGSPLSMSET